MPKEQLFWVRVFTINETSSDVLGKTMQAGCRAALTDQYESMRFSYGVVFGKYTLFPNEVVYRVWHWMYGLATARRQGDISEAN
jgi:hypothetical protein